MAFGLGVLRHSSRAFWAMTPRELAFAWRALHGAPQAAPSRSSFNALMRAFPDDKD